MSTTAKEVRELKKLKHRVQYRHLCQLCGRSRAYLRLFQLCRLCFRKMAHAGVLPGVKKASW